MQPAVMESTQGLPARELLRIMELSRQGDRREGILLRQSRGWFQVAGMGHEAIAALAFSLRPEDALFPYYRDRALMLARGMSSYELALAYFAKRDSFGRGRQMHGHYGSRALNVFPVATPVASECIPAAGAAWAAKLRHDGSVVVCTIGDGALRQGEYFEAVTFAVQENLPLIMVVEDNGYAISTSTERQNPYRLGVFSEDRVMRVHGSDAHEVYACGARAIERARQGGGPTVLWCEVERLCSHTSSDDQRIYRDAVEIANLGERDPVDMLAQRLIASGELTTAEWERQQQEAARQVEADYLRAESAPEADPAEAAEWLFAPLAAAEAPPVRTDETMTMVAAINETLAAALEQDERALLFGEDIEDPKGGVFGLTKGLSTRFPCRVLNSPLAEATIIGSAVGLGAAGYRPIFEIQFIDFILPAINQLMTQAATLRWRSAGEWSCPLVLIAPCGAYLPGGGPWHSQSHEGMWAHIPGLRVVEPSTPEDAAGLLWSAIRGDDPTLFLVPKHIFRKRVPVGGVFAPVPLGQCAVRREGCDVTLVTWGNGTELAEEAAGKASEEGIEVEVLDLRTLSPCDWEGIGSSLAKTGRLVVLHEDSRTGGFGQVIIAEAATRLPMWDSLYAAPRLVTRGDVHIPYLPALEYGVLPDVEDVMRAVREVMGRDL